MSDLGMIRLLFNPIPERLRWPLISPRLGIYACNNILVLLSFPLSHGNKVTNAGESSGLLIRPLDHPRELIELDSLPLHYTPRLILLV